jgi:hypothetical protein
MHIPTFLRHRRDEDGRKQPRQRHDGEDDDDDDYDDDDYDDDQQQQEHQSRCFGRSNSLLFLLSLFLTGVVVGSGFFLANILHTSNILRSGENVRPITTDTISTNINTNINTNSNGNSNSNNSKNNSDGENLSITTTTEDFVLFVKEIYRQLLRKYTTTTKAVDGIGSVHEYEYDGVDADGNYTKDEMLERELKSSKEGSNRKNKAKSKGDGDGDGKSSKKGSKSNKSEKKKGKRDGKKGKGEKKSHGNDTRSPIISPISSTLSPTGNPSPAPTDSHITDSVLSSPCDDREECEDCETFRFNNEQDKDCDTWVSEKPDKRCKKNDPITGKAVKFFCPVECKKICIPEG